MAPLAAAALPPAQPHNLTRRAKVSRMWTYTLEAVMVAVVLLTPPIVLRAVR